MLRQFMMDFIGAFGFLALFVVGNVLFAKFCDQWNPWLRAYSKQSIRDGYQLKLEVKGIHWSLELMLLAYIALFIIIVIVTMDLFFIIIILVFILIFILYNRATYICCLYSNSILIGLMNFPKANDLIMEIPLNEIISIDNEASHGQNIKTTYLSTFSYRLRRCRKIYILCQHENRQRYFKIRVTDEIYENLNSNLLLQSK